MTITWRGNSDAVYRGNSDISEWNGLELAGGGGTYYSASSDTFVVSFAGSVGVDLTGEGLGLSGADLVLTDSGANSVPASVDGFKQFTSAQSTYFAGAMAILSTAFTDATWTIIFHIKDFANVNPNQLMRITSDSGDMEIQNPLGTTYFNGPWSGFSSPSTNISTSGEAWVVFGGNGGDAYGGFVTGSTPPANWAAIPSAQKVLRNSSFSMSGRTFSVFDVGRSGTSYGTIKIKEMAVSKLDLGSF